jgi:hypothetical protein
MKASERRGKTKGLVQRGKQTEGEYERHSSKKESRKPLRREGGEDTSTLRNEGSKGKTERKRETEGGKETLLPFKAPKSMKTSDFGPTKS